MTVATIEREALRRIVASVVTAETRRTRGTDDAAAIEESSAWADNQPLSVGAVILDSLETVHAAAALYEMFGFDEVAPEPPRRPVTVGDWLDDIAARQCGADVCLTLMTSGSTGRPKPCTHAIADLQAEAAYFCGMLPSITRVIALIPAHHIYGLIWTALLPARIGVPMIAASAATLPRLGGGDLIIAVPDQWQAMLRSGRNWPPHVRGISAGAPLDQAMASDLIEAGLESLHDVYGSSEAGGIAVRDATEALYTLLPRWRFASPIGAEVSVVIDRLGRETELPDRLSIEPDDRFAVLGRRDGAVQVGGVNVWPAQVAAILQRCVGVAEIAVRLGDHGRLKAFVVPAALEDERDLLDRLRRHARRLPQSEQRPTAYSFGTALPRNSFGKACDWS